MANKRNVFSQCRDAIDKISSIVVAANDDGVALSQIECDILLERLRLLYCAVSDLSSARPRRGVTPRSDSIASLFAPPEADPDANTQDSTEQSIETNPYDDLFNASGSLAASVEVLTSENPLVTARKAAEEAAARKAAEEAAARKAAEEAAARKAAEEVAARKAAEEAAVRKAAEEAAARKAAEEAAARKAAEEAAARKAAEEAKNTQTQPQSLKDLLTHSRPSMTLGEQLGGQNTVVGSTSKVSDLRTIININDRFSFMTELFHNDLRAYNDFILHLNAMQNRNEALQYTEAIAAQYAWDKESLTAKTFYSVFDRKF